MNWDDTFDVVVVGSGNGGLTAALTSHEFGMSRVLVVEKGDRYGGSSARSGGGLWIPCNHYALAAGAEDSLDEARTYLRQTLPADADWGRVDAYLQSGPEMVQFLHDRIGARYQSRGEYPDYFTTAAGARLGHRLLEPEPFMLDALGGEGRFLEPTHGQISMFGLVGITQKEAHDLVGERRAAAARELFGRYLTDFPWRLRSLHDRRLTCGSAGIARFRQAMMQRNLPLWRSTRLVELVCEEGRVQGLIVEREGRQLAIRARRGVVLATGGFDKNQQMRMEYLPKPTDARWSAGVDTAQGDGIRAGLAVGGALARMNGAWWCSTYCVPGKAVPYLAIIDKCSPGSCVVNLKGRRIGNESQNYMSYMLGAFAAHSDENPSSPAYMVFDARFRSTYMVGPLLTSRVRPDFMLPRRYFDEGLLAKANSITELARRTGIDPQGLGATIARMNVYARNGQDLEFSRGDSAYDRYYGDPRCKPNPCLATIEKPPFYAVRVELGDFGTHGGLVTDVWGQVCRDSGESIPGLYAIGNTAAALLPTYPVPGSTLGPAMVFGYRAARHMAGD